MSIIDSHAHLNFEVLLSDIDGVIGRAKEAGLSKIQTICTKLDEFEQVHKIAHSHDGVLCSVGLHPLEVNEANYKCKAFLAKTAVMEKVIGVGETGLDYHYNQDADHHTMQKYSFIEHIEVSIECHRPIIIHSRDAEDDTIMILRNYANKGLRGVLHCFTGSLKLAMEALALGFYISASGIITFKNAVDLRDVFKAVPLDRLLIETDSPYLAPIPYRGKTNEPSYVVYVAKAISEIMGIDQAEVTDATARNFYSLFTTASIYKDL